ncbi:hypothetical protein CBR_g214 [Chara braunii]|uniref:2-C-methyl-D-erythritol 4-phosphate cytidylyltransferase n=1 Tax=Chara braunii TaxID=69332 RepID=A0A388JM35_CHABU|nr:hypothetical protein CBR_g214 [Chara braunii]|eukprot:GBG58813.1 hypothetical protein CBR_g214 [Chara braunii]
MAVSAGCMRAMAAGLSLGHVSQGSAAASPCSRPCPLSPSRCFTTFDGLSQERTLSEASPSRSCKRRGSGLYTQSGWDGCNCGGISRRRSARSMVARNVLPSFPQKGDVPPGSVTIILLSGGVGTRMKATIPKQYLPLQDQPLCLYSFHTFASLVEVGEIVIVCDPTYKYIFEGAVALCRVPVKWAVPGKERQDSVFNGLQVISSTSTLVAVHDSARPLITAEDTRRVIHDAWEYGAAVLGVKVKGTIKEVNNGGFVEKTLDRSVLWEVQTPQVIRPDVLLEGFDLVRR